MQLWPWRVLDHPRDIRHRGHFETLYLAKHLAMHFFIDFVSYNNILNITLVKVMHNFHVMLEHVRTDVGLLKLIWISIDSANGLLPWGTKPLPELLWTTQITKIHGANMGPTWVLSVPDGPHVGPMNLCGHGVLPWYRKHYWIKWQCFTYFLTSVWRHIWKLHLNWCRLLIGKFLWYSSASICVVTTLCDEFEKDNSRITATLHGPMH